MIKPLTILLAIPIAIIIATAVAIGLAVVIVIATILSPLNLLLNEPTQYKFEDYGND